MKDADRGQKPTEKRKAGRFLAKDRKKWVGNGNELTIVLLGTINRGGETMKD